MNIRVKFLGGAGTVTGSKYLLEIDEFRLLVDCGLFQGLREFRRRNWNELPLPPSEIDAVIITHAHLDHSGYLPRLFKQGFNGPVHCTAATSELIDLLLKDSAKLQEEEAAYAKKKGFSKHEDPAPLYDLKDVSLVLPHLYGHSYREEVPIREGITCSFYNAGHILGAAIVKLTIRGEYQTKTIVFSGDLGRKNDPILESPDQVEEADVVFIESTYGAREHNTATSKDEMIQVFNETFEKNGCLIIPAFSIGRTQNILMYLKDFIQRDKIPEIPIFMDSPMAIEATNIYRKYVSYHKLSDEEIERGESFIALRRNLRIIRSHEESKALNEIKGPAIIISASGMMTGGRILHHMYNRLPNTNDTLMIVGFQAVGTRGWRILQNEPTIRIFGQDVPVKCRIFFADGLSAHADQSELMDWARGFTGKPKYTFIVHGEKDGPKMLSEKLSSELGWNCTIPSYLDSFQVFDNI